jgi:hypothetical protein
LAAQAVAVIGDSDVVAAGYSALANDLLQQMHDIIAL